MLLGVKAYNCGKYLVCFHSVDIFYEGFKKSSQNVRYKKNNLIKFRCSKDHRSLNMRLFGVFLFVFSNPSER